MPRLVAGIGSIILFLAVLALSVFGVETPVNVPVRTVGSYQIGAFENGLSFFEGTRGQFYSFSPFNDYFVYPDGSRNAFIPKEEVDAKTYTSDYAKNRPQRIMAAVSSFLSPMEPSISFTPADAPYRYTYTAEVSGNKAVITRTTVSTTGPLSGRAIGLTFSYRETSFVYSPGGSLFTFQSETDAARFTQVFGIPLQTSYGNLRPRVAGNIVIVTNTLTSGTIVLVAGPQQRMFINRNTRMVEVESSVPPDATKLDNQLEVYVFNTPADALAAVGSLRARP